MPAAGTGLKSVTLQVQMLLRGWVPSSFEEAGLIQNSGLSCCYSTCSWATPGCWVSLVDPKPLRLSYLLGADPGNLTAGGTICRSKGPRFCCNRLHVFVVDRICRMAATFNFPDRHFLATPSIFGIKRRTWRTEESGNIARAIS